MLTGQDQVTGTKYSILKEEALPSVAASAQIFANVPLGTKEIMLTVRTKGLTMRFDGGTPTASANGTDISTGTYTLQLNRDSALLVKAIEQAATATGWIAYFGVK